MSDVLRVCQVLESIIGVTFSPDDYLRARIPNSMMLMQAVLMLEDQLGVSIDLTKLDYNATVADLTKVLVVRKESSVEQNAQEVALSPIQIAYLLGSETDLELGGQATFIYVESSYSVGAREVVNAVESVIARHDVFSYQIDLAGKTMCLGDRNVAVSVSTDGSPEACLRVRKELMERARRSNETGPLVSIWVLGKEDNAKLAAYFNMIIMDAGSLYIFFREIEALLKREPLPKAMSFSEALSLASRGHEIRREEDLVYWREKAMSFPSRSIRECCVMGTDEWHTVRYSRRVTSKIVLALERVAKRADATLSALLLASCMTVVAKWQNLPRLVCNVTVSHRAAFGGSSHVLGDFTSSMLVGVDVQNASSIADLANAISRDIYDGLAHGSVSGVEVMSDCLRGEEQQQLATAPVVFTSYLGGVDGTQSSIDYVYTQTAQVCLDMQVMPVDDGDVNISWDVVPQYYPYASEMFDRLASLLDEVAVEDVTFPLIDFHTEALVKQYNNTRMPIPSMTLLDLVENSVVKYPDRIALRSEDSYTYRELWRFSGNLAAYLVERGVGAGACVVIEFTKHPADIIAMISALRVGAAYVPIGSALPLARRAAVKKAIRDCFVLTTETAGAECLKNRESVTAVRLPSPDDPAYIIFTSGSTGTPKGVEITHRGAVGTILDINNRYGVNPESRIIGLSSLGFDLSVYDIFGAFAAGASLSVVANERDADQILDVLQRDDITLWNSAPALMELTLLRCEVNCVFKTVKTILLSGDRIPASMPSRIRRVFPNAHVYSLGGATEASIWSIQYPLQDDSLEKKTPYGYPLTNQGIYILGYDGTICPMGVPGEIWISGAGVAAGYVAAPELTAQSFREIPGLGRCYRTGDLGVFNHEGYVDF